MSSSTSTARRPGRGLRGVGVVALNIKPLGSRSGAAARRRSDQSRRVHQAVPCESSALPSEIRRGGLKGGSRR